MEKSEGRSLAETPTWAVATVITVMVGIGFLIHGSLKQFGKWLDKTKRKSLLAALEKIKGELMLFGLLSLLMGHWIIFVANICVKSSTLSGRFYPCPLKSDTRGQISVSHVTVPNFNQLNNSVSRHTVNNVGKKFCPEGHESFASYESLEQLHRFLFVLGVTHVSYSFIAIALAMIKIYSWRTWENQAKLIALQGLQGSPEAASSDIRMRRLSTFIYHQTSHPWSQHRVFVWMLCFSRQFWSSINRADYMALRLGFITTHQLPLSYDFHNYMLRSMEEEFQDIVGISVPLWIFTILCVLLSFHGTNVYFWISFLPALLILLVGTKLHRIVVKLAVEYMDESSCPGFNQFNLRDELFWFGKPRLLLLLVQFISFQNAFEMATFIWSLWEIREPSCFMENHTFLVIRLVFGLVSHFWCSFITFPLYVIVTQMGSRFKKSILPENVRKSLHGWRRRVKGKQGQSFTLLSSTSASLDSMADEAAIINTVASSEDIGTSTRHCDNGVSDQNASLEHCKTHNIPASNEKLQVPPCSDPSCDTSDSDDDNCSKRRDGNTCIEKISHLHSLH